MIHHILRLTILRLTRRFRVMLVSVTTLLVLSLSGNTDMHAAEPTVPFIFDTDIGNDVDDVLALGMIHALESRGECKLLAVTLTKDHPQAAAFVDAVNTFYGRGEVPIGVCHSKVTPDAGKFLPMADQRDDGSLRYPHDLLSGDAAPTAVSVLRRALAASEDHQVVIAQVGFSTNLADLLKSQGDEISPLTGVELVRQKVRLVSLMAGAFTKIPNPKGKLEDYIEYNVVQDIPSAAYLAEHCPVEMVWSGFEIGLNLTYPHQSIEQDYRYVKHHPLAEAYWLYMPPPHDRPTWDLTSVLFGIRPARDYFQLSEPGTVRVDAKGLTLFTPDAKANIDISN